MDDLRTTRRKAPAVASAGDVKTTAQLAVGAEALTPRPRARAGAGAQNSGNPGVSTSTVTGGGGHTVNTRNIRLEQFRCVEIERDLSSAAAAVVCCCRVRVSAGGVTSFFARQVDACKSVKICLPD